MLSTNKEKELGYGFLAANRQIKFHNNARKRRFLKTILLLGISRLMKTSLEVRGRQESRGDHHRSEVIGKR